MSPIVAGGLGHVDAFQQVGVGEGHVKELTDLTDRSALFVPEGVLVVAGVGALPRLVSLETILAGQTAVTAVSPGQLRGEPSEGVVNGPGDDEVVVDDHQETDHQHAVAQALSNGRHPAEDLQWALACPLTQGELHEEERQAGDQQHGQVGDQESHA